MTACGCRLERVGGVPRVECQGRRGCAARVVSLRPASDGRLARAEARIVVLAEQVRRLEKRNAALKREKAPAHEAASVDDQVVNDLIRERDMMRAERDAALAAAVDARRAERKRCAAAVESWRLDFPYKVVKQIEERLLALEDE